MKILDCTLRDGGYYNNWDFDDKIISEYAKSMEKLPIDYIEVGYRSIQLNSYLGKFFYCPEFLLKKLKTLMPTKNIVIMLNEKDLSKENISSLLVPIKPYVKMIRVAVNPKNFKRAIRSAKEIKSLGFEVAFNVMYMSNWGNDSSFLDLLDGMDKYLDYFYMVDSYGGILPDDIIEIIKLVQSKTNIPLGFHGHDNLHMSLINSITAYKYGCKIVDSTITGMGRGAGNLKTELLLTYLSSIDKIKVKQYILGNIVSKFEEMQKDYGWGTNLPYMFSGANSLPQKEVMDWVSMNRYSFSSILNALNNQKLVVKDNIKLPIFNKQKTYDVGIILGGGNSVLKHKSAIFKFLEKNKNSCLIHAGVRNISEYRDINNDQFYSLVGIEGQKLLDQITNQNKFSKTCIFAPYPRKMGTSVPSQIKNNSFELKTINFTDSSNDSPFVVSAQLALDLNVKKLYLIGFDGYDNNFDYNKFILAQENQTIINDLMKTDKVVLKSLTKTKYKNIKQTSIYSLI